MNECQLHFTWDFMVDLVTVVSNREGVDLNSHLLSPQYVSEITNQVSYSTRLLDFLSPLIDVKKVLFVNSFFPSRSRLWNSLSVDSFLLTCGLNNIQSRFSWCFLSFVLFLISFRRCFSIFCSSSPCNLRPSCHVQLCMEGFPINKSL